ncbi:MAG: hypothetical protein II937_13895 [Bacteroidales bacterium]|nr:hypothetical protein [Bacteroidales bacterium]
MLRIKHLSSAALLAQTKFSADPSNTTYYQGLDTVQQAGTPDVLYDDLVFCKGNDLIYTHGHFYGSAAGTINDDLIVSGDATINGSLTIGNSTITGVDDSLNSISNNPVKNSTIYNTINNIKAISSGVVHASGLMVENPKDTNDNIFINLGQRNYAETPYEYTETKKLFKWITDYAYTCRDGINSNHGATVVGIMTLSNRYYIQGGIYPGTTVMYCRFKAFNCVMDNTTNSIEFEFGYRNNAFYCIQINFSSNAITRIML